MQDRCKRVFEKFPWVPRHQRLDRLGQPLPPSKLDLRKPLYRLERLDGELYFVNDSHEMLKSVSSKRMAVWATGDDELAKVPIDCSQAQCSYMDVQPGEAVKIDEFDAVTDSDFLIQTDLTIKFTSSGGLTFRTRGVRGGCVGGVVLLWDSGDPGEGVSCVRLRTSMFSAEATAYMDKAYADFSLERMDGFRIDSAWEIIKPSRHGVFFHLVVGEDQQAIARLMASGAAEARTGFFEVDLAAGYARFGSGFMRGLVGEETDDVRDPQPWLRGAGVYLFHNYQPLLDDPRAFSSFLKDVIEVRVEMMGMSDPATLWKCVSLSAVSVCMIVSQESFAAVRALSRRMSADVAFIDRVKLSI